MNTIYVPKRQPRTSRPRLGRIAATVLIGAAGFAGIGAALSAGEHHPPPAVVTVAHHAPRHHERHHEHHHQAHAKAGKAPKLHLKLHLRLHVPYALRPHLFRRLFWRPRFTFFRRRGQ